MKNWLLDTNALIWYFTGSERMKPVQNLFSLPDTHVYISVVSWWEMAIKIRSGKLSINISQLESFVKAYDFIELPLTKDHLPAYFNLPNLHKDPFDHMLLSQAITCPMRFITGDAMLAEYSSLVMVV